MSNVERLFNRIRDITFIKNYNETNRFTQEDLNELLVLDEEDLIEFKKIAKSFLRKHFDVRSLKPGRIPIARYLNRQSLCSINTDLFDVPYYSKTTSGSTFNPVKIKKSLGCKIIHETYTDYIYSSCGIYNKKNFFAVRKVDTNILFNKIRGNKRKFENIYILDASANISIIIDYIHSVLPEVLLIYPSILDEMLRMREALMSIYAPKDFGRLIDQSNEIFENIDAVVTIGERVSDYVIEQLKKLKIKHIDIYSSEETGYISHCADQSEYKTSPFVDVSIREKDNHIIVTDLFNFKTPVINYDIGDIALVNKQTYSYSDSTVKTMPRVKGRTKGLMKNASGLSVWPSFGAHELSNYKNIARIQVVQDDIHSFKIYIKLSYENDFNEEVSEIGNIVSKNINKCFGQKSQLNKFEFIQVLEKDVITSMSKHMDFICRI